MGQDLFGKQVLNTYDSIIKVGDNDTLTGIAKQLSDGRGNDAPIWLSTARIGFGITPDVNYTLTVNGATKIGSLDVTGAITGASLQLLGGSGTQGTLSWNTDEETVDLIQNGATLQLGQEIHIHVRNNSGATINDGTPVYATGTLGASGRITVAPMIADGSIAAKYFLGVTTEDIPNGQDGKVTTFGKIRGLNTSAYTEGQTLFVSTTTAGAFQTTVPVSPNLDLEVAIVISSKNNGTIFVRAQQGYYLGMLHDVYINGVSDGDLLVYDSANTRWKNESISAITNINLDTVTDNGNTTTNSISVGDINAGNVTLTGYLRGAANFVIDPAAHGDDTGTVQILGNLRVDGTTTTINSTTVTIADKNIVLAEGSATAADANGAGITIDGANATMTYNSTSDRFVFNKDIETNLVGNVTGNVTGDLTGNADTASALETARNIALDGDVTGNADFDGSANITITTTVANDSHTHDTRYYTKTQSDDRFVNVTGDTMTGDLNFSQTGEGVTWVMNTDGASIKFYNTGDADTNSRLEFQTTDNNNEYFRWTHRTGATTYELMRLTGNGTGGNLQVSGTIQTSGDVSANTITTNKIIDNADDTNYIDFDASSVKIYIEGAVAFDTANNYLIEGDIDLDNVLTADNTTSQSIIFTGDTTGITFKEGLDNFWGIYHTHVGDEFIIRDIEGSADVIKIESQGAMTFTPSNGEPVNVTNNLIVDSRIGVGVTSPSTAIDVDGTVTATNFIGNGSDITNVNADLLDGFNSLDLYRKVFSDYYTSSPARRWYVVTLPFIAGSGGSAYYYFDVLGFRDIGNMASQLHYRVYLHVRANGVNDNDIDADVLTELEQASEFFTFAKKDGGAGSSQFYIRVDEDYSGIQIVSYPANANLTASMIASQDSEPTGFSTVTPIKYLTTESDTLDSVTDRGSTTTNNITANSFIKSSGTSSQFLKADGSVDSNTYITDITTQTDPKYLRSDTSDTMTGNLTLNGQAFIKTSAVPITFNETGNTGDGQWWRHVLDGGNMRWDVSTSGGAGFTTYISPIRMQNNGDVLLQDGSLGIGTTTPSNKLTVDTDTNNDGITLNGSSSNLRFNIKNDLVTSGQRAFSMMMSGSYPALIFQALDDNYGFVRNVMAIEHSGEVGIGTITPSYTLDVNGSSHCVNGYVDNAIFHTGDTNTYLQFHAADQFRVVTGGVERLEVNNTQTTIQNVLIANDFVGIGTTTPISGLNVNKENDKSLIIISRGGSNLSPSTSIGALEYYADFEGSPIQYANIEAYANSLSGVRGSLGFNVKSTSGVILNGMTIYGTSSGVNVGIGTTSPSKTLDVNGVVRSRNSFNLSDGTTQIGGLFPYKVITGSGTDNSTALFVETGLDLHFMTNGSVSSKMIIKENGNVGIGTTSPASLLHLVEDSGQARLLIESPSGQNSFVGFQNTGGTQPAFLIGYNATDSAFVFYDDIANTERMRLDSSGRLLVGKQSSNYASEGVEIRQDEVLITNSGGTPLSLNRTTNDGTILSLAQATSTVANIGSNGSNLYFDMVEGGNVGIGTTSPTNKLDVNGTIRARGGVSTDNSAKEYYWHSNNTGNSGTIWRKIGTYNASGQSSRIMITAVGTASYGGGQNSGKTTLIAQVNNNNLLEGTFWQEGMATQYNSFGIVSNSSTSHDIYFQVPSYSEYAFEALISDGTFTTDATTVTPPTFTRTLTRTWNVNANLWVNSINNVGIGTSGPAYKLDVNGTIRATGDVIAYSDSRVKENVKTIDNALDKVTQLRGVSYNKIGETEEKIGVIAQEIEKVLPQVVQEDDNGMKSVAYGNIVGVLIEAIKEQQKQIDELKAQINGSTN